MVSTVIAHGIDPVAKAVMGVQLRGVFVGQKTQLQVFWFATLFAKSGNFRHAPSATLALHTFEQGGIGGKQVVAVQFVGNILYLVGLAHDWAGLQFFGGFHGIHPCHSWSIF